jgi:RNA polymerase sigma-70 factor (ECF subfamily)
MRASVEDRNEFEDKELIRKYVSTGNSKYFSKIIEMYDKKLFNYIARRIGSPESARDVYQTVWLKVASNLKNYKEENKFSNYLFFIATNASFDHLRELKKSNENIFNPVSHSDEDGEERDFIENLPSADDNPEKENEKREEHELVSKALDGLPDEQKDVILLRTKGLTFREIAEIKAISVNSVLSRYRYAVDKIKYSIAGGK